MNKFALLGLSASAIIFLSACGQEAENAQTDAAAPATDEAAAAPDSAAGAITGEDLARHIQILASDEFEGRAPTTPGGEKARNYIAGEYERLGLEPVNGSYFQNVPMVESTLDPAQSYFRVDINGTVRELGYKTETVFWTKRVEEKRVL